LEENFDRFNIAIHKEKEMADFRRWFLALAIPLLFTGLASAQVGTSGSSTPLTCNVNTSSTPTLRSEGITELIGQIVITCTGGSVPANLGSVPPATANPAANLVNITISLTTQVTSRLLGTGASEAILMIDEPNSGLFAPVPGFGPGEPFTDCTTPSAGAAQAPCGPDYILTQTGTNGLTYFTTVTSSTATPTTAVAAPNVYQGVVTGNQVTFFGVPVVPPGTNGTRVFRVANVRINASGIGGGTASGTLPVQASILTSNPAALPITNPTPLVGFVQASLTTSVSPAGSFGQCNSQTDTQANLLTFSEKFANAFKTRVDPTVVGQTNGQGAGLLQDVPGTIYNSESGFTLSLTSTTGTGTAGLADAGTRFTAVFNNLQPGVHILVSQYALSVVAGVVTGQIMPPGPPGVITPPTPSSAQLITSETTPDGPGTIPAATPTLTTPSGISLVDITPTTGTTTTASWELMATTPTSLVSLTFGVYITYTASPGTNSPTPGTATASLRYGPATTVTTAAAGPIPAFLDTSTPTNAFTIAICQTVLLYPFVTNQAGFDTGIAIANTSSDPFGTPPQTGTCSLNWYGTAAPTAPTTTPTVTNGTDYTLLASATVPGFQGYMIAVCNFQYAHGFAFISDVGATKLAMGYLALVVPDPPLQSPPGRNAAPLGVGVIDGITFTTGEQLVQ
jgi:large repetitive protein